MSNARPIARGIGSYVLANSGAQILTPADTTEDVLATIPIPAGAMGPNGFLRINSLWGFTGSTNAKSMRIRLGGISGTVYWFSTAIVSATFVTLSMMAHIFNRGAQNSQVATGTITGGISVGNVGLPPTGTIDTSVSQDLVITGQKASAGEVLALDAYSVEIFPKH
jgi:hypothetical protein